MIYKEKYCHLDEHLRLYPFPQNIVNENDRKQLWKEYRQRILEETGVVIFMFGNKIDKLNTKDEALIIADGLLQEFEIAKEKGNIIIPIGSTGWAAKKIYDEVLNSIEEYPYLKEDIKALGEEMDSSTIIKIIIKILKKVGG